MNKLLVLLSVVILLFGCINLGTPAEKTPGVGEENGEKKTEIEPQVPSFRILSPIDNEVIEIEGEKGDVQVTLGTTNMVLRSPTTRKKVGEGHFIVILDNNEPITLTKKSLTLRDVPAGTHTLTVEFVHNDNSHYFPKIIKTITFTLKPKEGFVPETAEVVIQNNQFVPSEIKIKVGGTVTWYNNESVSWHSVTFEEAMEGQDSGSIRPGESYSKTFDTEGVYHYHSNRYPSAKGTVEVVG